MSPRTRFVVDEHHPFGGPLVLDVGARRVVLGRQLAASLPVRLLDSVQPSGDGRA